MKSITIQLLEKVVDTAIEHCPSYEGGGNFRCMHCKQRGHIPPHLRHQDGCLVVQIKTRLDAEACSDTLAVQLKEALEAADKAMLRYNNGCYPLIPCPATDEWKRHSHDKIRAALEAARKENI